MTVALLPRSYSMEIDVVECCGVKRAYCNLTLEADAEKDCGGLAWALRGHRAGSGHKY